MQLLIHGRIKVNPCQPGRQRRACSSYIVNTVVADGLVKRGPIPSAALVLTYSSRDIPVSAPEEWSHAILIYFANCFILCEFGIAVIVLSFVWLMAQMQTYTLHTEFFEETEIHIQIFCHLPTLSTCPRGRYAWYFFYLACTMPLLLISRQHKRHRPVSKRN